MAQLATDWRNPAATGICGRRGSGLKTMQPAHSFRVRYFLRPATAPPPRPPARSPALIPHPASAATTSQACGYMPTWIRHARARSLQPRELVATDFFKEETDPRAVNKVDLPTSSSNSHPGKLWHCMHCSAIRHCHYCRAAHELEIFYDRGIVKLQCIATLHWGIASEIPRCQQRLNLDRISLMINAV